MPRRRLYVGFNQGRAEAFRAVPTPTKREYGYRYAAVIGPFRTRAAAELVAHGAGPQVQTVTDAERAALQMQREEA